MMASRLFDPTEIQGELDDSSQNVDGKEKESTLPLSDIFQRVHYDPDGNWIPNFINQLQLSHELTFPIKRPQSGYYLLGGTIMRGFRNSADKKMPEYYLIEHYFTCKYNTSKGPTREERKKRKEKIKHIGQDLADLFKIHLMPPDAATFINSLAVFFKTLDTNEALRNATHYVKIIAGVDFPESPEKLKEILMARADNTRVPPPIVIYATIGKENAQFLLNSIYELFKDVEGADIELKGNMEVTKFIRIAGGNYNEKDAQPKYFDKKLIFYKSDFVSKKHPEYHGLKNPNPNAASSENKDKGKKPEIEVDEFGFIVIPRAT